MQLRVRAVGYLLFTAYTQAVYMLNYSSTTFLSYVRLHAQSVVETLVIT